MCGFESRGICAFTDMRIIAARGGVIRHVILEYELPCERLGGEFHRVQMRMCDLLGANGELIRPEAGVLDDIQLNFFDDLSVLPEEAAPLAPDQKELGFDMREPREEDDQEADAPEDEEE